MTATRKVLFCTDLSPFSQLALFPAEQAARQLHAKLCIVHVSEPPAAYGSGELIYAIGDASDEPLREALQKIVPSDPELACEHHLLVGEAGAEVVRFAADEHVDLIVASTHGRTGLARILLGSVAEYIVRHSPCSVLIVKRPAALVQDED